MRIKNKYIRNRSFRNKHWNRIRSKEHPYETYMPSMLWSPFRGDYYNSYESQVNRNLEEITKLSRALENGNHKGRFHATSEFRRIRNKKRQAKETVAMQKIRGGNYDVEFPPFKKDADWFYF